MAAHETRDREGLDAWLRDARARILRRLQGAGVPADAAEDIAQETLTAVFELMRRSREDGRPIRSLEALLLHILRRRIADHWRRKYRRPEELVAPEASDERFGHAEPPPIAAWVETMRLIGARLNRREQRLISLWLEGYSDREIGMRLSLRAGTVAVIRFRALRKIREGQER